MGDEQIRRVWEGLITSETLNNYFAELSHSYHSAQRLTTWATLALSSGTLASLLLNLPPDYQWVRVVLALLSTALSAYAVSWQNQKRAFDAAELAVKWGRLAADFRLIWENVEASDALPRLRKAEESVLDLSKAGMQFPARKKNLLKWQSYVEERHPAAAA